jgi:hypothetical protein
LRDDLAKWKEQHGVVVARCQDLNRRLGDQDQENNQLKERLKDARSRLHDSHREKQRLEKMIQDLRARKPSSGSENSHEATTSNGKGAADVRSSVSGGLRELKLGRSGQFNLKQSRPFRNEQAALPPSNTGYGRSQTRCGRRSLLELVNAKTAEAVARQELEEVKGKLESLRKMLGVSTITSPVAGGHRPSQVSQILKTATVNAFSSYMSSAPRASPELPKAIPSSTASGGFSVGGERGCIEYGIEFGFSRSTMICQLHVQHHHTFLRSHNSHLSRCFGQADSISLLSVLILRRRASSRIV